MTNLTWIPQPQEVVLFNQKVFRVLKVNLGGKCTLRRFTTTRRIGEVVRDVDVSELTKAKTS
jgi:hypothetical protein